MTQSIISIRTQPGLGIGDGDFRNERTAVNQREGGAGAPTPRPWFLAGEPHLREPAHGRPRGFAAALHYFTESPYLDIGGAQWLVARSPSAVVFDFFEEYMARFPDFTSEDFVVHRELLGNGIVIVEGATNLGAVKGAHAIQFFAPFFKLAGTEGAPARLFAIIE